MALRSYSVLDILLPSIIIICKTAHKDWIHINVCRVSCGGVFNILLVLSIIFYFHYNIWGCMCSTDPFQYRWLKGYIYSICYHHHQIGSIHLSHCHHIFRGCVPEVFVTTYSITYCTYVPGKPGICFHYYCAVYDRVQIVGYVLACRSYSFVCTVHHLIVIIVQTYLETLNLKNACQIYFVECVSKIKHILSVIHYTICGAVYFSLPISLVMIERIYIYTLSHYHHQIGNMNYYPL